MGDDARGPDEEVQDENPVVADRIEIIPRLSRSKPHVEPGTGPVPVVDWNRAPRLEISGWTDYLRLTTGLTGRVPESAARNRATQVDERSV